MAETILPRLEPRSWAKVGETLVLEERNYRHVESRIDCEWTLIADGVTETRTSSMQVYGFRELTLLLSEVGFEVCHAYSSLDCEPYELGRRAFFVEKEKEVVAPRSGAASQLTGNYGDKIELLLESMETRRQSILAMTSVLLFDVGETILDAVGQQEALMEAHRGALAQFGFEMSVDEYKQLDREKMLQFVPSPMHAITWHLTRPDVCLFNEITARVRSHYPDIRALGLQLYPGAPAVLEELAEKYTLALAGNAPAGITKVLDELGVLRWFRHREVSGTIGIKKPDERFFA